MTLPIAAMAVAERQAAGDRDLLARLVAEGRVARRSGAYERENPELTGRFTGDIARRNPRARRGMDTIRPKAKKNGRRS